MAFAIGMRKQETLNFKDFMSGQYKGVKKKSVKKAAIIGTLIPLAFAPKAFAAEQSSECIQAVTATPQAIPVGWFSEGASKAGEAAGKEIVSAMAQIFDPIITIIIHISLPVAGIMILWKLFMSYFRDTGDTWEGIGKIALNYCIIQMFPLFLNILKGLGAIAGGI
jgi:hypothetical protein